MPKRMEWFFIGRDGLWFVAGSIPDFNHFTNREMLIFRQSGLILTGNGLDRCFPEKHYDRIDLIFRCRVAPSLV